MIPVMPIAYGRRLTGNKRTVHANRQLGRVLAFIAGAINAGGYLAVKQYTSHMTGIVSSMADNVALGEIDIVLTGLGALLSFVLGAVCCAILVNYARRRELVSEYALPLLVEAFLLLGFGLLGARLSSIPGLWVPATVLLLCFIMGLQNAIVTKLSNGEIRTTHMTGVITDFSIELGKLVYWNRAMPGRPLVLANRDRLNVLGSLVVCFFVGGVAGALGFRHLGYLSTVPLAITLVLMAAIPVLDDLGAWVRRTR